MARTKMATPLISLLLLLIVTVTPPQTTICQTTQITTGRNISSSVTREIVPGTSSYWAKTYGGFNDEGASSVQQTTDGGYIVAGTWLLKLDSAGSVVWQKTYGGTLSSVEQTTDGGYIIAGGYDDFWVLKLNATGGVEWQKTYGGSYVDHANSVKQTSDGGYIVAGYTISFSASPGAGYSDAWVLKLNSTGSVEWQKAYGGNLWDYADSVQQTSDGGYIVTGTTYSFVAGYPDVWVLKLNSTGAITWQKAYGGTGGDLWHSVEQTSDGGYIAAGETWSFGVGGADVWVLKLDSTGSVTWQKTYGGSKDDVAHSVQQTSDGGYILAGTTDSFGAGHTDAWVLKVKSSGSLEWQKSYGGSHDDSVNSIEQTSDDGYIAAGHTNSFGAGGYDFWVLKLNSTGSVMFNKDSGMSTQTTNVVPSDSDAAVSATSAIPADSIATVQDTHVTPQDTNAIVLAQTDPDTTPPATIGHLATINATEDSITLTWTAPGDDYYSGNATGYILKYSTSGPITDANWASATSYAQSWRPKPPHSSETQTISGLSSGTWYWFAVKAYDEVPNYSGVSNSPRETTVEGPSPTFTYWARTYGGTNNDYAQSVRQTADGGYIVAGYTTSFGAGHEDAWVLKLDPSGSVEWQKTYGGSYNDGAYSVQQTADGGYIVAGYTTSFGAGYNDFWVLKLTPSGSATWQKTYGGTSNDIAYSVQQTSDGGYIVAGTTGSFGAALPYYGVWVLKLNSIGGVKWQKTYGDGRAYSVQQTSDGGYIVAGENWVLKLDSMGLVEWKKAFRDIREGPHEEYGAYSVQQTSDRGYILAGYCDQSGRRHDSLWALKLNSTGFVDWQKTYRCGTFNGASSIEQTSDGGYIVAGYTHTYGSGSDLWVLKLASNGSVEWQRASGGSGNEGACSVRQTLDGRYIIAGSTDSFRAGGYDFWVLKLDSGGHVVWNKGSRASTDTTSALLMNSNAVIYETSVSPLDSAGTVQDTHVKPQDTNAIIATQAGSEAIQPAVIAVILTVAAGVGVSVVIVSVAVYLRRRSRR